MYIEPEELDNRQKDSLCRIINYTGGIAMPKQRDINRKAVEDPILTMRQRYKFG
jgi:hypothetical protein